MSNPLTPNYVPGVGRLVADRFDFQAHITGTNFRHTADQIDLTSLITIDGYICHTVQDAVSSLALITAPPIIASATTSSQGIIQLSGDIAGVATAIRITGLQGKPVNTLVPHLNDVLTWNGISWGPSAAINAFTANGDLTGNNLIQQVVSLSGLADTVSVFCDHITFSPNLTPVISQSTTNNANGANLTISAQNTTSFGGNGGNVVITGGNAAASGKRGGVLLQLANTIGTSIPLQAVEVAVGRRVLALMHPGNLTITDMPANTGDMIMYVRDAVLAPSSGSPVNGTIVYSSGGQLWVKQANGNNFAVGSIPNPSIWGTTGQETYTSQNYTTTTNNVVANVFTFVLPDETATRVDAIVVGKATTTADSAQFNLSMGYVRHGGGAPVAVGTITSSDPRTTAGAVGWTQPTITVSGNTLLVQTGANTGTVIDWFVITQLTMSS